MRSATRTATRTVVVPAAVAAAALVLSACSSGSAGAAGSTTGGTPAASASAAAAGAASPSSSATSTASPSTATPSSSGSVSPSRPVSGAPWATVALTRTSAPGSRAVSVKVTVTGKVFRELDLQGKPLPGSTSEGQGSTITWGDGGMDGSDPGEARCATSGSLVPLSRDLTLEHTFAKPGTYTFTFTQQGCGLTKPATQTLTITVR